MIDTFRKKADADRFAGYKRDDYGAAYVYRHTGDGRYIVEWPERCLRCEVITGAYFDCSCDLRHALCWDCQPLTDRRDCCHIVWGDRVA